METQTSIPEKLIGEFVERLQASAGENLQSVILYGSAAAGEFHPEFSNINLLCIVREISFAALDKLQPTVAWWTSRRHAAPLLLTREELVRSADVFAIEFMDMKQRHRVLYGEDVLGGLVVPMHLHRAQVEYELREKLILLRERMLPVTSDRKQLWELLLNSLATFTTLFRHALIALGSSAPASKREAVQLLAGRVPFDPSSVLQLLDVREKRIGQDKLDVREIAGRYLAAVQQTVAAVDTMLDSPGPRPA
jgi:hypothetical protein